MAQIDDDEQPKWSFSNNIDTRKGNNSPNYKNISNAEPHQSVYKDIVLNSKMEPELENKTPLNDRNVLEPKIHSPLNTLIDVPEKLTKNEPPLEVFPKKCLKPPENIDINEGGLKRIGQITLMSQPTEKHVNTELRIEKEKELEGNLRQENTSQKYKKKESGRKENEKEKEEKEKKEEGKYNLRQEESRKDKYTVKERVEQIQKENIIKEEKGNTEMDKKGRRNQENILTGRKKGRRRKNEMQPQKGDQIIRKFLISSIGKDLYHR